MKKRVAYLPKEQLMQLDVRNKTQKKPCIGIAKFYGRLLIFMARLLPPVNGIARWVN